MKTLGLVMIVKDEERCLGKCLEQAKGLVDKIFITDTGSTDRTKEIAASFGAAVTDYIWNQDFAAARNFALGQSDCDWNLVLDADEYLIKGTRREIEPFMENMEHVGAVERKDLYVEGTVNGQAQIGSMYTRAARLLPRGVGFKGRVHEQEDSVYPAEPVPLVFEHDGYLQGGKGERNLSILLEELKDMPDDPYVLFQAAQTLRSLGRHREACAYYSRFYKQVPAAGAGYRAGGIISYLYSLIESQDYDRALSLVKAEEVRLGAHADFHFARGILYMRAIQADTGKYVSLLPLIEESYLRCLEIGEVPLHQGVCGCGSFKAAHNLGIWYEVSGDMGKALKYYRMAAGQGYGPAKLRLHELGK